MRKIHFASLAAALLLLVPSARSQTAALAPVEDRRKAMNAVFHDSWEDNLEHAPEFASILGDKRWNDKISDRSVKAFNEGLAREQAFMLRLAAIDPTGFTDQEKTSRDLFLRDVTQDEEAAEFKEWEMPVDQRGGIYSDYPQLVESLTFTTVKDYDDWIARLRAIPHAFEQVTTNMSIGMDDHRLPLKSLLEKALEQVKQLANQKPEDSALAIPLKKFPPSIPAPEQERIKEEMLSVIGKQVLPAYQHFAHFMEGTYIPAARTEPGISALSDGAKYYQFLIRRTTTTDLTADQIHQIGLDEVKRNETDELAIAHKLGFDDLKSFRSHPQAQSQTSPGLAEPRCWMRTALI